MLHTIDVYEALTSSRVYRNSFTQDEALTIMKDEKGYDKNVLEFLKDIKI